MITDKNFRLKRSTKMQMALMAGSKEDQNHYKKMMIDAQVSYDAAKRAALKSKDKDSNRGAPRGGVAPD